MQIGSVGLQWGASQNQVGQGLVAQYRRLAAAAVAGGGACCEEKGSES